jgi:hypothetical protein
MQTECRQDTGPFFPLLFLIIIGSAFLSVAHAEDWTTTDGKIYKNIKVVKVEVDAVTILDEDGGARIPLAILPPDLQKRFNYDSVAAKKQVEAENAEQNQENVLNANKLRLLGNIFQIVPEGIIVKAYFINYTESASIPQDERIRAYQEGVFIACDTTGLIEGQQWKGIVWKIGTHSYTSAAGTTVIPKYTANASEAYTALAAFITQNSSSIINNDITPIKERQEWKARLAELSSILEVTKKEGGTFATTKGVVYNWKDITEITPVQLSYMTDANVGNIPFNLLPSNVVQKFGLTFEESNKWSLEEAQLKKEVYQKEENLVQIEHAKLDKEKDEQAQRNQYQLQDSADHAKAKEMAIKASESLNEKIQSLSDDLEDLKNEMDREREKFNAANNAAQSGVPGSLGDALSSDGAYKALEDQYEDKESRYEDAKRKYEFALDDAEYKFYQQLRLEESQKMQAQEDAKARQIAPTVIPADSATNTAPAQTKDAAVTTPQSP